MLDTIIGPQCPAAHTEAGPGTDQTYTYDTAGRLTNSRDTHPAGCTNRNYHYDKHSNRTALTTTPGCGTTGHTTKNSTYDQADRITNPGYTYDPWGRTTLTPAADATNIGTNTAITGDLAASYHSNDLVASLTQAGHTRTYTLDPQADRIATIDDGTTQTLNTYTDTSDNPAWTQTQPAAVPEQTPYVRIGKSQGTGEFRVSVGNTRRHWEKTSGVARQTTRLHLHISRRYAGADWHNASKTTSWRWWGAE